MARKRKKNAPAKTPFRVKVLVAVMLFVIVAGVGSVKLFQTTRGRLILLDVGVTDYYGQVQEELEGDLRAALRTTGLQRDLDVRVKREQERRVREWSTVCRSDCSPARIGLAFTKAAKGKGAVARSTIEGWKTAGVTGEDVRIEIGSRRFVTHRITVRCFDKSEEIEPATVPQPRLALVIDDFGYARSSIAEAFLDLDMPLTIAVIPELPRTDYAIRRANEVHKQAILHVPMEAEAHDSDVEAVMTTMSDEEIRHLVTRYLDGHPGIVGINNHMGSKATRDPRVMEAVVSEVKRRDLFFFDSLTSSKSVAYNTAKEMRVPTAKNDLFLDAETEDDTVVEQRLHRLVEMARERGSAVGIGHPKPWTYVALKRNEELLRRSGVELVFVSELME
jgi:polysaccharide deacetylase 2 family uncharacterized protein YibQ